MALLIQDSFTATNGTVLSSHASESGATYARHASFTVATITIEDNRAAKDTDVATAVYYVNNITDPKFFEVEFTIIDKSDVNRSTGIEVGIDTGSDTAIIYRRQNATTWQLLKIITGTPSATLLSASETFSAEASHTLKLKRIPETNDYECFLDSVSLGVVTISDAEFLGAGKIGIRATNSQGAGVGYHLDNLSVHALTAPRALHRGRNFPLFDDEEVNRFEFWPAVAAGVTEHERSAAVDATATITVSGLRLVERSVAVNATADVTVSGARVVDRSVAIDGSASVESSAISFSVAERTASMSASASVEVTGLRIVERSSSLTATASIESAGIFFSIVSGAAQFDASATIQSSAEFFSIFERQLAINATATITVTRQVELFRTASLSATADIAVSGGVEGGVVEYERSAAIDATVEIQSSGIFFSVVERASEISAIGSVVVGGLTVCERSVSISAVAAIESSGSSDVGLVERSVAISATATITVSGGIVQPTPPRRTFVVSSQRRAYTVPSSNRAYIVAEPDREEEVV